VVTDDMMKLKTRTGAMRLTHTYPQESIPQFSNVSTDDVLQENRLTLSSLKKCFRALFRNNYEEAPSMYVSFLLKVEEGALKISCAPMFACANTASFASPTDHIQPDLCKALCLRQ
jgi:hypothetical protein